MSHQQQVTGLVQWVSAIAMILLLTFGVSHADSFFHAAENGHGLWQADGADMFGVDISGANG